MSNAEIIRLAKLMCSTSAEKALEPYTEFSFTDAELLNVAYQLLGGSGDKPYGFTTTDPDHIARCLAVAKEIGTVREFTLVLRTNLPTSDPDGRLARMGYKPARGAPIEWNELGGAREATIRNQPTPRTSAEQTPEAVNASRDRLIEAGHASLQDLLAEWRALPIVSDLQVRTACLTRIRKIDPELAERLSLRFHAEMQKAVYAEFQKAANDPGG
jgi:hypothetical protein